MERFAQARSQMIDERRKIEIKVDKERRKIDEFIDNNPSYVKNKRVFLYGQKSAESRLERNIRKQLAGL